MMKSIGIVSREVRRTANDAGSYRSNTMAALGSFLLLACASLLTASYLRSRAARTHRQQARVTRR
ncbi:MULTISPECIES: hypothetical protein [Pandoraea]|uniref:Uncharacterized protein n=1 Tax=Pandoraea communis TaxID=2508297 RepID=A0A5E4SMJ1_9BURK|nr:MULTISPECIES: hypothetical protein [Pandoraea]EON12721.1 hypothetical protein C266_15127 [Pandoraea sp. SD6-2]VVD76635.1 hypothetical protein PCO31110_00904 [Pandoraea communis]